MRRFALVFLMATPAWAACTVSGTTLTAASASSADVQACFTAATASTTLINIPAGTATWTSGLTFAVPSGNNNLTIQGATIVTCTGTAGTSGYSCSSTANTVITDGITGNTALMDFTGVNASTLFRITGLSLRGSGGAGSKFNGVIQIGGGNSQNVRFDHNDMVDSSYTNAPKWFLSNAPIGGVADHNYVDSRHTSSNVNDFVMQGPYNDGSSTQDGDGTWANPTPWGNLNGVLYVESNYMLGGYGDDCAVAGSMVMRYNYYDGTGAFEQTHATKSTAFGRACRSIEVYHNYLNNSAGGLTAFTGAKGGPLLIWGNTVPAGVTSGHFWEGCTDRQCATYAETAPTAGWGYCGSNAINPNTGLANGSTSAWDGNTSSTTGYPCLDGIGRGQTALPMNGLWFPGEGQAPLGVAGSPGWPHQYLEPQYLFDNNYGGLASGNIILNGGDLTTTIDRDIFYDCGAYNPTCSNFNGSHGTGFGTLANRPIPCTSGSGSDSTSPTGSYGVAYWATDANNGNGELYVCTATGNPGTWTPIYQPAVYPHPLIGGGTSLPPPSLILISGTNTGIVSNWSINGNSCATGATTDCISSYTETLTPPQSQPVTILTISGSALTYTYSPGGNLLCGTWNVNLVANWLDYSGSPTASPPATGSVNEPCPTFVAKPPTGFTLAVI